jgi:hypothetical protein
VGWVVGEANAQFYSPLPPPPLLYVVNPQEGGVAMPVAHAYTGTEGRMIAGAGREPGAGGEGDDPVPSRAAGGPAEGAAAIAAASNPFGGPAPSRDQAVWASNINKKDSDSVFRLLPGGQEGRVSGAGAKDVLLESGLDVAQLRAIWELGAWPE